MGIVDDARNKTADDVILEKLDMIIEAQEEQQVLLEDAIERLHDLNIDHKGGFEYEQ